jgi:cytochrome P450
MIHYTPFLPEATTDPYPLYRRLLEEAPVYYIEEYDGWALSRFADVWSALEDAETFGTTQGSTAAQALSKVEPPVPSINQIDPPHHTRLRRAIKGSFTKNHVASLEPEVRSLAVEAIERGLEDGRLDGVRELADPIAGQIACRLLDLPPEDGPLLTAWVHRYVQNDPEDEGRSNDALAASMAMNQYLAEFAARWRRKPGREGALVQAFLEFEIDGRKLDDLEVASHLQTIVIGGTDTTPKGVGAALLRLHQHPDQRARLASNPAKIPAAFHEVLRYDMPTQFMARTVMRPTELHGQKLEPGQGVLMMLAAANRDPREFPDPDRFDVDRNPRRILSFGHAVHICLGAHVARLEGRVLLEELLSRAPDYHLDEAELEWRRADQIQGIISAPISF